MQYDPNAMTKISMQARQLRWLAKHDYWLAITLTVATFAIFPFGVLILPYLWISYLLINRPRVGKQPEDALRVGSMLGRNVFVRRSDNLDTHIYSAPFVSVLQISPQVEEYPQSESTKSAIRHEMQHHKRHDGAVVTWLLVSSIIFVIGAIVNIPLLLTKSVPLYNYFGGGADLSDFAYMRNEANITWYSFILFFFMAVLFQSFCLFIKSINKLKSYFEKISNLLFGFSAMFLGRYFFQEFRPESYSEISPMPHVNSPEVYYQTGWFWNLTLLTVALVSILTLIRVLHRFELIADNQAASSDYQGYLTYLKRRLSPKIKRYVPSRLDRLVNYITHPSDTYRFDALTIGIAESSWIGQFRYTAFWSFAISLSIAICF